MDENIILTREEVFGLIESLGHGYDAIVAHTGQMAEALEIIEWIEELEHRLYG